MSAWALLVARATTEELEHLEKALLEVQTAQHSKTLLEAADRLNQKYGVTNRAAGDLRRWAREDGPEKESNEL